jgi:hypothetical protein
MLADVTHSYVLTTLPYSNVGGRLVATTTGYVFSCLHDVSQNVNSKMKLVWMSPPSISDLLNVKTIELTG